VFPILIRSRVKAYRALAVLILGAVLLGWSSGARAASAELTIRSGFDGRCKLGGLNPVTVEVKASADGCRGELKLKVGERTYVAPVDLEAGGAKTVRFSVPLFSAGEKIEAALEVEGREQARTDHAPVILPESTFLLGLLSDSPASLSYLTSLDTQGLGEGQVVTVALDRQLPYRLEELDNINLIAVEDFRTAELNENQARLLEDWVRLGNCLLVGAGEYSHKTLTGVLAGLRAPLPLGDGIVVPVAGGLVGQDLHFLRQVVGRHFTAYALAKAVRGTGLSRELAGARKLSGAATESIRPEESSWYLVMSLLLLYVLCVGVAAFFGRQSRWAYGALVVCFSLLFLGLSLYTGISRAAAGGAGVRLHGPLNRTFLLTCVYPYAGEGARIAFPGSSFAWALQGGRADALAREIYSDASENYVFSSFLEVGGSGDGDLALTVSPDGLLSGRITNPLPYTMEHCFLIVGDTVIPVGRMKGRERFTVDYRLDHNLSETGDYNYLELLYRAAGVQGHRRHLIDYYFCQLDDYGPGGRLIGFTREEGAVEINGRKLRFWRTIMHVFPIRIGPEDGRMEYLPPETIRPIRGHGLTGENEAVREYPGAPEGELKVYYVIPRGLEPTEIVLAPASVAGNPNVLVFNPVGRRHEILQQEVLSGEKLQEYLSDGPLVLSLRGELRMLVPQVAVKGVAAGR
jgi:hypothetical protein